ncbi:MAG: HNH endonuclease [Gemmatimonadales bacterium]|nr:MAG: HNH endonuclease [Gemmatimonadales bacterium]
MRRLDVFRRDDFTCVYCGSDGREDPEVELSVDHVEPRVKGGDNSSGNLVTACISCNRAKGGLAAWAYLEGRDEERGHFLAHTPYLWPRLRTAIREAAKKARR